MAEKEYIEREILLKKNFYTENCNLEENRWNDYAIKDIIMHIPAADVAPVRHGRWINENFYTCCSVCGNMAIYDKYGQEVESDYCPRCGAKMDGGDQK